MKLLTDKQEIRDYIQKLGQDCPKTLWLDTEVADFWKGRGRLSIIQILQDPSDTTGDTVTILDVLDKEDLAGYFIDIIMSDASIEKVFHNAEFDVGYLGGAEAVKNVSCTLKLARALPYYLLPVQNHKLNTLAEHLCGYDFVDKTEQKSNWATRPLSDDQLYYAKMDVIYLQQIHKSLLQLQEKKRAAASETTKPATEKTTTEAATTDSTTAVAASTSTSTLSFDDLNDLSRRYVDLLHRSKMIDSELEEVQEKLKTHMLSQSVRETAAVTLRTSDRTTTKTTIQKVVQSVSRLAIAANNNDEEAAELLRRLESVDSSITVTAAMKKALGEQGLQAIGAESSVTPMHALQVKKEAANEAISKYNQSIK